MIVYLKTETHRGTGRIGEEKVESAMEVWRWMNVDASWDVMSSVEQKQVMQNILSCIQSKTH